MGRSKRKKKAPAPPDVARMERQLTALSGEWRNLCRKLKPLLRDKIKLDNAMQKLQWHRDFPRYFHLNDLYRGGALKEEDHSYGSLKSQLKNSRRKVNVVLLELKLLESRTRQTSESYGKATCQSLCGIIRARLPRELRDLIYGYILDERRVAVDYHQLRCECLSCKDPYGAGPNAAKAINQTAIPLAHLRSTDYMGVLGNELGEYWYEKSIFVFDQCGSIREFLRNNVWSGDLRPQELVQHVEINISCFHIYRRRDQYEIMRRASNLEKSLEAICLLRRRVIIDFIFETRGMPPWSSLLPLWQFSYRKMLGVLNGVIDSLRNHQTEHKRSIRVNVWEARYLSVLCIYLTRQGLSPSNLREKNRRALSSRCNRP
ncbi:hypothetical protein FB567DRAFT_633961 [Paraphoma chrysanthemicola]|uniref:Uncharacterized protein n=1 Tax=Paraphoma chrysanthemicola TaxID=798071 RepID=A0A8K0QUU1_9PLEO|nr:hypothetical protein FB567DRAFT_633961 [Paraphoma chrysanthemicola]